MLIVTHVLVGAAIGIKSANIFWAFLLAIFSHYLIDVLPHWDYLDELTTKIESLKKIGLDFILGITTVLILTWPATTKSIIIIAVLAAILPDILLFLEKNFKIRWLKALSQFHNKIHLWQKLSFVQGMPATLIVSLLAILSLLLIK